MPGGDRRKGPEMRPSQGPLPDTIRDTNHLDELLSEPTDGVVEALRGLDGDLMVLGVGGKMGPSLARMARRAMDAAGSSRRVIGVSRFSSGGLDRQLREWGVETIACDLLDDAALEALPDCPLIVYMAGMKFGSTGQEALTWAMNCHLPARVGTRFRGSRIAAFSTGNVYPFLPVGHRGAVESDLPAPVGEYAMSCLGRERMLEHFSRSLEAPVAILRLNYAVAIRYGVLADIAWSVWSGQSISLETAAVNVIWQADANAMALQSLARAGSPPFVLNIAGPEQLCVRSVAERFGEMMGKAPRFRGEPAPTALLSDGAKGLALFGAPRADAEQMMRWLADWVMRGGECLGKPTHFEARDGRF